MIAIRLKYQSEIEELINQGIKVPPLIPPDNKVAFRYVFSNPTSKNHLPAYKQNPKRMLSDIDRNQATTSGLALSCYEQEEKAIERYGALLNTSPNVFRSIGDSLCVGNIENSDGLITHTNKDTHFDLYEFVGCDLSEKFKITKKLV